VLALSTFAGSARSIRQARETYEKPGQAAGEKNSCPLGKDVWEGFSLRGNFKPLTQLVPFLAPRLILFSFSFVNGALP